MHGPALPRCSELIVASLRFDRTRTPREHTFRANEELLLRPDVAIFVTSMRIEALASRARLAFQHWEEPGLGPRQGFFAELPIGVVVHAEECLERLDLGTAFYAEVSVVQRISLAELVKACIHHFGLSADQVTWMQSAEVLYGRT